jgi:hypothetical protein
MQSIATLPTIALKVCNFILLDFRELIPFLATRGKKIISTKTVRKKATSNG